jgi:uncharacterized protein YegJ (DUF2314 family)
LPYGDPVDRNVEHIWVVLLDRNEDRLDGVFANDPVYLDYAQYDPISFGEVDISDWMYWDENGLMQGAYTIRAMLPDLPADQAEQYRRLLAPLPQGTGSDG